MAVSLQVREVQVRLFVPPDQLRETVAFYKALTGGRCTLHFPFPERGMELASVSSPAVSFLIIGGDEASIRPFRETKLTMLVDDIETVAPAMLALGAQILQPVTPVPTGFQTRARHPDGLVVEYVQHTAAADRYRVTDL
ncbi:MAG TPA: hypothetical protein VHX39_23955 [Acetobacteraceae bacterium]|nr:hypothetical protein [Acetobacteraceae bacterium]